MANVPLPELISNSVLTVPLLHPTFEHTLQRQAELVGLDKETCARLLLKAHSQGCVPPALENTMELRLSEEDWERLAPVASGWGLSLGCYCQMVFEEAQLADESRIKHWQLLKKSPQEMAELLLSEGVRDTYHEAVREMIDTKVEGDEGVVVAEDVTPVIDIMAALRESIAQAKGESALKATPRKKKTPTAKKTPAKRKAA